jgi:PAS domain-containing protein
MDRVLAPLSNQWQLALLALIVVMGALVWRAHRQVRALSKTSVQMQESLGRLERTTESVDKLTKATAAMHDSLERLEQTTKEITARTSETEETLRENLAEYRMALGSTNAYREYLQRMGLAPASDVEPILEAIGDGAEAVSTDGKVLYANRAFADLTSIRPGATLEEILYRCRVRTFGDEPVEVDTMLESRVLMGEIVSGELIRMRPPGRVDDVILSVNGQPARDSAGKVVAAVMLCREVSEEVAMAMEVRRIAQQRPAPATGVV